MATNPRGVIRHRISFEPEIHHALHQLALDRMATLQELADEAFRDLLKKHHRPVGLRDMLKQSARMTPVNDRAPRSRKG